METLFNPKRIIFFLLALLLLLTGCKFLPVLNPYYAKALTPSPRPPTNTPAPTLTRTPTVSPTATRTPTRTPSPSPTPIYCDWAEVVDQGYEDVSTDGVYISGASTFTYIWRLRNAGQCTWTPEYEMEVVEDDGLEVKESFSIDQFAVPGQIITIYLEIKVPDDTDEFTISWLLHNAEGESFGIGENADAPLELTFRVIQKPLPFAPVTRVPQAVVELCEMDADKERRINAFLKENAILPHLSEDSEDGITNEPEGYEPGMMMTFRVKDDSRNTFATLHKFLSSKRKTYVSIDGKYYVPDGTEVVFVEIPMTPPLKLLQKELQRLIPGYDGPTLTNEFPTMLGYYVHAIPLAGPDRCRPVVGAIFNDDDTEVYTAYRFPDEP